MRLNKKTEQFFAELAQARKALINPDTREELVAAQDKVIELVKSDEFGNLMSLSTIYQAVS